MEREYCVYKHTFPNGKVYIGQTKQKPKYRFNNGNGYVGCKYVYSAIKKYGWDNIEHDVLIDNLSQKDADYWESFFINIYHSNEKQCGYNLRTGGTSGYRYTEEVKRKMSDNQIGRKQSKETRKKHSEALYRYYSKHTVSEETRKKLSIALTGKKKTQSHSQKIQAIKNIKPHQYKKGHAPNAKSMQILRERYSKNVIQYDLDGNVIAEYPSIVSASESIGMSRNAVGNAVRGYVKTAGGYIWRYRDGN